jgi:aminopeptidase N
MRRRIARRSILIALPSLLALGPALPIVAGGAAPAAATTAIPWPEGIGPAPSPLRPREVEHRAEVAAGAHAAAPSAESALPPAEPLGLPSDCPHGWDALHYDVSIDAIDRTLGTLTARTKIRLVSETAGLSTVRLTLKALTVTSAYRDSTSLSWSQAGDSLFVTLDAPLAVGDTAEIEIAYGGDPYSESFGGFYITNAPPFTDYNLGVGLNANPPSMGRTWFPSFDAPCDKATASFHLKSTLAKTGVANGAFVGVDIDTVTSMRTWHWEESHQIATYLMAASIARYDTIIDPVYPWITHYVHNTISGLAPATFANVKHMMATFDSLFGTYPWDKFGYVSTNAGDMEHQTCVFHAYGLINGTTSNDDILSHEMTHQWWGDLVTYADWREIWLSEGFATYGEALFRERQYGPANFHAYVTNALFGQYLAQAAGLTYPIYDPVNKWGTISYEKGGSVLHMLRHVLGDATFYAALAAYRAAHGEDVATTEDFRAACESVYGSSLDWFFQEWIYSGGHPKYDWGWSTAAVGPNTEVRIRLRQVQTVGPIFTMPIDFKIQTAAGDTVVTGLVDAAVKDLVFVVAAAVTGVVFDPDDWVLEEHTLKPTGVEPPPVGDGVAGASAFVTLLPVAPNPTRGPTEFAFRVPDARPVTLEVFAADGRRVATIAAGARLGGGLHRLSWDARDAAGRAVASGHYLLRLTAGTTIETRRFLLVR